MSKSVESCPAEGSGEGEAEKHRIQKNKSGNRGVGILAKHHQGDKPDGWTAEFQFSRSIVCKWNAYDTEESIEDTHEGVVNFRRVFLARLEFERSVITSQETRQSNKHFTQRRVDIEIEFSFDVV